MKFRNPWIDPRVLKVQPADAEAYLLGRGWRQVPSANPNVHAFANSSTTPEAVVGVAQAEDARDYPQCVIDLVAGVALAEGRWAVDVLSDILQAKKAPMPVNGASAEQATETAAS